MVVLRAKTKLSGPAVWSTVFMVKTIKDTQKATSAAGGIYKPVIYTGVGYAFLRKRMGTIAGIAQQTLKMESNKIFSTIEDFIVKNLYLL